MNCELRVYAPVDQMGWHTARQTRTKFLFQHAATVAGKGLPTLPKRPHVMIQLNGRGRSSKVLSTEDSQVRVEVAGRGFAQYCHLEWTCNLSKAVGCLIIKRSG